MGHITLLALLRRILCKRHYFTGIVQSGAYREGSLYPGTRYPRDEVLTSYISKLPLMQGLVSPAHVAVVDLTKAGYLSTNACT